jgi:hypothetical protein
MDVCLLWVLSGRGLCDGLITRPEEFFWLWCVVVYDLETSRMRKPWPIGAVAPKTNKQTVKFSISPLRCSFSVLRDNFYICYLYHGLSGQCTGFPGNPNQPPSPSYNPDNRGATVFSMIICYMETDNSSWCVVDQCIIVQFKQKNPTRVLFLTASSNYTSNNLPRMKNQRLLVQF